MKKVIELMGMLLVISFVVYTTVLRFQNPELTETQLFLKILGIYNG